ncbi:MAG: hypothetical protein OXF02_06345 [Simkaniaceae bacterium]|nr:hypothetical protein [Simkaniaceae bacterium]
MNTQVATKSRKLNDFVPRPYQRNILKEIGEGKRRILCIWPRRAGKDLFAINYAIRRGFEEPGNYVFVYKNFQSGRRILWDGITKEGKKFVDYFPKELVIKKNATQLKVTMRTRDGRESQFFIVGADTFNTSLIGTSAKMLVFSEFATHDPSAYYYSLPIIAETEGTIIIISTPRGHNHLYRTYEMALKSDEWAVEHLTVEDTKHIAEKELAYLKEETAPDLFRQEYYCDFNCGIVGAYYATLVEQMKEEKRFTDMPWDRERPVYTSWDIARNEQNSIVFWQKEGKWINVIDSFEDKQKGLEYYAKVINHKPFTYGRHFLPHDIRVKEWGDDITRLEKAEKLLEAPCEVVPRSNIQDGIEKVRSIFPRLRISKHCVQLVRALENYRQEYDEQKGVYKNNPRHDWSSHYADAVRYMAISAEGATSERTIEEKRKAYEEVVHGRHATQAFLSQGMISNPYSRLYR